MRKQAKQDKGLKMFTVRVTVSADVPAMDWNFDTCAEAWQEFGRAIEDAGTVMSLSIESGDAFPTQNIRMTYMIDVPGVELDYANITIA